jgi:nitroreductase/NAD-dependent dihydropyrimidine dehydrogenase PreA subunit
LLEKVTGATKRRYQMTLLNVDSEKCDRDGICIDVCPARIIAFKTDDGFPEMIEGGDALCLRCGHCVAVCPHMAISHRYIPAEDCPPLRPGLLPTAEQAEHFLRSRRSIRVYKNKAVDRELLSRLIHVARFAPSGHNLQPVEWHVLYDSRHVHALAGLVIDWMRCLVKDRSPLAEMMHLDLVVRSWDEGTDRIFRGAPHLVIAHAHKENRAAQAACTIALTYLELMAPVVGLGACWSGYLFTASQQWPPILQALALPEEHQVFGAMMVGYSRYRYHRLPPRNKPRITWQ